LFQGSRRELNIITTSIIFSNSAKSFGILRAIHYMNLSNVVHRDIKLENLLLRERR